MPGETATKTNRDEDSRVVTSSDNIGGMNLHTVEGEISGNTTQVNEKEKNRGQKRQILEGASGSVQL